MYTIFFLQGEKKERLKVHHFSKKKKTPFCTSLPLLTRTPSSRTPLPQKSHTKKKRALPLTFTCKKKEYPLCPSLPVPRLTVPLYHTLFTLFTITLTRKKKESFLTRKKKEYPFLSVPRLIVPKKNERGNPFLPVPLPLPFTLFTPYT